MRVSTTACRALAAAALLAATANAEAAPHKFKRVLEADNAVPSPVPTALSATPTVSAHDAGRHPRGLFDGIASLFNPDRQGRADESSSGDDSNNDKPSDNNNNDDQSSDDNNNSDNNDTSDEPTPSKSESESSSRPRPSSDSEKPSKSSDEPTESSSGRESSSSSERESSSSSERETPSPTSESSSETSATVVTVTRPGTTRTTTVGPAPTIDQQDGNKADVGASGNQTSIIVATVVTAVALLLCTVLYYLYRRRKKSLQRGDDGFFTKGAPANANTISTSSPFIPPNSDGYLNDSGPNARHTDESARTQYSANDNTHLLAQQPRQHEQPFVQPGARYQQPMTSVPMAPGAAPNRFAAQPSYNPHMATGYAPQQQQPQNSMRANPTFTDASMHPAPRPPLLQQPQQHSVFSPQQHNHYDAGYTR